MNKKMRCIALLLILIIAFIAVDEIKSCNRRKAEEAWVSEDNKYFSAVFDSYKEETEKECAFCDFGHLDYGGTEIILAQIVRKHDKEYQENDFPPYALVIQNQTVWFVYSDREVWILASYEMSDKRYEELGRFESEHDFYGYFYNDDEMEYQDRHAYYYDGKIVVTDHVSLLEHDLKNKETVYSPYDGYEFPARRVYELPHDRFDYQIRRMELTFTDGNTKKVFRADPDGQKNPLMNLVLSYQNERYNELPPVNGIEFIFPYDIPARPIYSYMVQTSVMDDDIYIQMIFEDVNAQYWLLLFSYDFEQNECRNIGHLLITTEPRTARVVPVIADGGAK